MRTATGAILLFLASTVSLAHAQSSPPSGLAKAQEAASLSSDVIDDFVRGEMQRRHISGLSLAIIQDGKIVKAKGYGVNEMGGKTPVTASTLFQAGQSRSR
jgi:CubicO group peptidase (beta-lactamase class C family)